MQSQSVAQIKVQDLLFVTLHSCVSGHHTRAIPLNARENAVTREAPSCPARGTARAEQRTRAAAKKRGEGTGSDGSPGHRPLHRRARRCVRDLPGPCLTPAVARRLGEGEAGAGRGDFRVSFQACGRHPLALCPRDHTASVVRPYTRPQVKETARLFRSVPSTYRRNKHVRIKKKKPAACEADLGSDAGSASLCLGFPVRVVCLC